MSVSFQVNMCGLQPLLMQSCLFPFNSITNEKLQYIPTNKSMIPQQLVDTAPLTSSLYEQDHVEKYNIIYKILYIL